MISHDFPKGQFVITAIHGSTVSGLIQPGNGQGLTYVFHKNMVVFLQKSSTVNRIELSFLFLWRFDKWTSIEFLCCVSIILKLKITHNTCTANRCSYLQRFFHGFLTNSHITLHIYIYISCIYMEGSQNGEYP